MTRRRLSLGWIIPTVLAVTLAADLIGHALPTEWVAFRAWEAVNRYPTGAGRFTPEFDYANDHAYGDLAALANRPDWRADHSEIFTVDRFGFRQNPDPTPDARPYDDLLIGDSFAAGSGLSDDETLAVQMQRVLDRRIYNGAELAIDLRHLLPLIDRLGLVGGNVYYQYLERAPLPNSANVRTTSLFSGTFIYQPLRTGVTWWRGFWDVCPLTIWAHALYKHAQNDRLLPNTYAANVHAERLQNGMLALFLPREVSRYTQSRPVDPAGLLMLQSALRARGLTLRVVLVPEKYTAYAPLLERPAADSPPLYLDTVEAALRAAHVPVLNLLPVLRRAAADNQAKGTLPYQSDDTHWSAAGVRIAAEAIRAAWGTVSTDGAAADRRSETATIAAALPLAVQPAPSRMYVFGDSYSDSGAGYVDGDGPTAVVYLARRLGVELKPPTDAGDTADSLNFAVSGAQTGSGAGRKVKDALLERGMMDQVDDFVARVQSGRVVFDPKVTLFFLAGGLNDGTLPGAKTVTNLETEIRKLHAVGARRFRVALMPVEIPAFKSIGLRLNPTLRNIPEELRAQLPDAQIALSNWGPFFDDVMNNAARYGIENTKDRCAGRAIFNEDTTPCAKPSAYYYYHDGHPSTAVHKVVGDKLYAEVAGRTDVER